MTSGASLLLLCAVGRVGRAGRAGGSGGAGGAGRCGCTGKCAGRPLHGLDSKVSMSYGLKENDFLGWLRAGEAFELTEPLLYIDGVTKYGDGVTKYGDGVASMPIDCIRRDRSSGATSSF